MKADRSNEFVGMTMAELARSSLDVRNMKTGGLNRMDMVGRAFTVRAEGPGYNSTSDFPNILQNVAYKAMMKGYTEADETFDHLDRQGHAERLPPGLPGRLAACSPRSTRSTRVPSTSTGPYLTAARRWCSPLTASFSPSRVRPSSTTTLHYFNRVPLKMGRAAKRTIGNLVYAILNTNPLMQDGLALFSSAHGNVTAAGSGSVPNAAGIAAARVAMARQKDDQGLSTGVGIVPKFILVPPELWDTTNTVLKAEYIAG